MSYFGLAMTRQRLVVTDDRGLLLGEAATDSIEEILVLIRRVGAQPNAQLVVTDDQLRECSPLGLAPASAVTLCIAASDLAQAACALARIPGRSVRRRAAVMAQLPTLPWISRFLRRAAPPSEHQLSLL